ncbi:hypothetical protein BDW59DRAFT_119995 [Aspergillus cavernicola]|uniref:SLC26A/SulP transporter domain-containing protein n=1 Tax=Aspergillus cavernicola TaxID=176166 RepID=A0ABR4HYV2_9EURO
MSAGLASLSCLTSYMSLLYGVESGVISAVVISHVAAAILGSSTPPRTIQVFNNEVSDSSVVSDRSRANIMKQLSPCWSGDRLHRLELLKNNLSDQTHLAH